jgi:hypothetical protein
MADLWFVLVVLAFFGLCVVFVRGCDLIIGADEVSDLRETDEAAELAAEAVGR